MGVFSPEWLITLVPASIIVIIAVICLACFCTRAWRCHRTRPQSTTPQDTDGPIHDPGIYNESFTNNQPVFTIPGSAFMPYNTGLPINYVISATQVITITSESDNEDDNVNASTLERQRRSEREQYDNSVTLSVGRLRPGPPRYDSLYFCPPPEYEQALEITDIEDEQVTYYV